jgi:alanyl-tRNA synthetase
LPVNTPCLDLTSNARLGGRGGGKDQQAQAICDSISKLDEAVKVAREFASLSIKD